MLRTTSNGSSSSTCGHGSSRSFVRRRRPGGTCRCMPKASGQVPLGFGHFFSVLGQRLQPSRFFAAGRGRSCQGLASSSGRGFPASRPQKCFALIGRGVFGSGGQGLLFRLCIGNQSDFSESTIQQTSDCQVIVVSINLNILYFKSNNFFRTTKKVKDENQTQITIQLPRGPLALPLRLLQPVSSSPFQPSAALWPRAIAPLAARWQLSSAAPTHRK